MSKTTRTIKYTETAIFILIWAIILISPIIMKNYNNQDEWKSVFGFWMRFAPFLLASSINHFLLIPKLYYRYKMVYFSSVVVLIICLSFVTESIHKIALNTNLSIAEMSMHPNQSEGRRLPPPPQHFMEQAPIMDGDFERSTSQRLPGELPPFLNSILAGLLMIGFDFGLRISFKWTSTEQEKELLEKEKVKSELAFLRNQISPHFFMNTLNNIHALVDIDTEEAKESIIRLSQLMRHLLYDSEQELIPLTKEIEFIQSYVDLMKLRFTEKVKVTFNVATENNLLKIPPLLFTSLIENAFKYGVSYKQKSFINIVLFTTDKELKFTISNSKMESLSATDKTNSGIGLENTRKRLDLLYHGKSVMNIDETPETFSVELKLPL